MKRFFVGARTADRKTPIIDLSFDREMATTFTSLHAVEMPREGLSVPMSVEEARALAEQLLAEAAFCENWRAVMDRREGPKP